MPGIGFDIFAKDKGASAAFGKIAKSADATKDAMERVAKANDAAAKASTNLRKTQAAEADAIGKVRVAAAKLEDIRGNSKAKTAQIAAAEEALAAAQRKAADAADANAAATKRAATAQDAAKGAAKQLAAAQSSAFDKVSKKAKETAGKVGAAGEESGNKFTLGFSQRLPALGSRISTFFKTGIGTAVGLAAGAVVGAGFAEAFSTALEQGTANAKLQGQLGLTNEEAAKAGKIAGDLYTANYGDSIDGVNDAIKSVIQNTNVGLDSIDLKPVTAKVLDLASVFDQDLGGVTRAVGQSIRTGLAKNASEALDFITKGFQAGDDKAQDFLDTLNEYGTQFRKVGIDGKTATGLISQGLKAGARDADIVADAIKEFSIRAIDGSTTTAAGFKSLGLSAKGMSEQIAKGGKPAAAGLDLVLDRLRAIKDPVKQSQVAVELFGTQAEDLGKALFALDPSTAVKALGDVAGAAGKFDQTVGRTPQALITGFFRTIKQGAITSIGGMITAFANGSTEAKGFQGVLENVAVGARKGFDKFSEIGTQLFADAKGWAKSLISGVQSGFDTGDWKPLGKSLGNGIASAARNLGDGFDKITSSIGDLIDKVDWASVGEKISSSISTLLRSIDWKAAGDALGDAVVDIFQKLGDLSEKVRSAFKTLMDKVDWKRIGRDSTDAIGKFVEGVDWIKVAKTLAGAAIKSLKFDKSVYDTVTGSAADLVIGIAESIGAAIGKWFAGAGTWLYNKGKDLVSGLFGGAAEQGSGLGSWFQDHVISPVVGAFSDAGKWLVQHGRDLFTGLKNGITDAAKGIGDWIMRAPVAQVLVPFLGAAKWLVGPGKNVIAGLVSGISSAAKNVGNWIGRNVISPVVGAFGKAGSWLVQHGKNLLAGFENGVAAIAKGIGSFFYNRVISPVVVTFSKAGTWLAQAGKNVIAGFTGGVSAFIASMKGIGTWFYNHVIVPAVAPFSKAGTWLVSHGKNLIAGLLSGISQDMKGIGKWIKVNVVDPVVGAVKKFFGIKSPSTVFAGIGSHLVAGLMKGLSTTSGAAIAKKVFGDMPSALRSIIGKGLVSVSNLPKKALDALGSSVGIGAPIGGPSGNTNNEGIVRTLAAQRGWGSGAEWSSLRALIMGESGFNSNAQNPTSSAYGIFQFLDSTWGSVGASKTSDPWAQTIAGLKYIAGSYGDPINAYSKWSSRSPHWYGNGGLIAEKVLGVGLSSGRKYGFGEHGAEVVTPMNRISGRMPNSGGGQKVVLEFRSDGSPHMEWLAGEFRKYVRVVGGGNVQQALGTR